MNTLKERIGARIQDLRKKRGLTQEKLSELVNITPVYLSGIERGRENPTLDLLINILEKLDVQPDEIFSCVQNDDPVKRKDIAHNLLDKATDEQLKILLKILSAIIN
ncbi:MAG: helix-turn-helix transcriptional regulator [bacterium]